MNVTSPDWEVAGGCEAITATGRVLSRVTRTGTRALLPASTSNVCSPGSRSTLTANAPLASVLVSWSAEPLRWTRTVTLGGAVPRISIEAAVVNRSWAGAVITVGIGPASSAPASHAAPIGRVTPRWSVGRHWPAGMTSRAGLLARRSTTLVSPPWLMSSSLTMPWPRTSNRQSSPDSTLPPSDSGACAQFEAEFAAMIDPRTRRVSPEPTSRLTPTEPLRATVTNSNSAVFGCAWLPPHER